MTSQCDESSAVESQRDCCEVVSPSTARPSTNDSRVWLDADGDDEPTPEEIAAALGYGSLIGAFLTVGFCFLFRRATAGLKIFPDEKELDFDAI